MATDDFVIHGAPGGHHDHNGVNGVNGFNGVDDINDANGINGVVGVNGLNGHPGPAGGALQHSGPAGGALQQKAVPLVDGAPMTGLHGFADFFSGEVFSLVLHNPTTAYQLLKFSQSHYCGENMEFLELADRYAALVDELARTMTEIHRLFTSVDAPRQINISDPVMRQIHANVRKSTQRILPSMELIFAPAQEHIKETLGTDIYPRFVKYQMTCSAAKALGNDREKYQGLGDCFCLTDPAKADNPIVFASDGFVKVTGYPRCDIIPRNCRFLQGKYTDRSAVRRLKIAIQAGQESVELLLNYKRNGDPFWNLLYVAPLFDVDGRCAFFLGGQINCSTTVHSYTDILRILSVSDDPNDDAEAMSEKTPQPTPKSRRGRFRNFWNINAKDKLDVREAGMESGLLKRIEKMSLATQMKLFYTAYSRYLVISHHDMQIRYHSKGIAEILSVSFPLHAPYIGRDIFKVLQECVVSPPRNLKSDVKKALSAGSAISVVLRLPAPRASVSEASAEVKCATHWTPLKDETARVAWIVLTMGAGA